MKAINKNNFLVFLLVANSGFPLLYKADYILVISYIITLIFSLAFYLNNKKRGLKKILPTYLIAFTLIFCLQILFLDHFSILKFLSFYIKTVFVILILKIVGPSFYYSYVKIISFFTKLSFFFYIPIILFPQFKSFLQGIAITHPTALLHGEPLKNLIVFNLNFGRIKDTLIRNSGPFWEPGAFAGFLIIAIFFNILIEKSIWNKRNIILVIGLITTFSTSGLIALMVMVIFFIFFIQKKSVMLLGFIPIFLFSFYYAFNNVEVLGDKIKTEILFASNNELEGNNRIKSFVTDINDFTTSPYFGLGLDDRTRYLDYDRNGISNRNNGISDYLVRFGLIGFSIYFLSMYKGIKKLLFFFEANKNLRYLFMILIFIIGFSELYFRLPFFMALSLIPFVIDFQNRKVT